MYFPLSYVLTSCVAVAFDVHLAETFVPLSVAMTLVSAPRSQLLEDLSHWLRYLRVTHVGIVPSLIEATLCALEGDDALDSEQNPSTLRYIASGGEKMSDSVRTSYPIPIRVHITFTQLNWNRFLSAGRTTPA
jgi:non-ribosomal peptide synthetase component F